MTESIMDLFLDYPRLKLVDVYYKVVVFREKTISDPNKNSRFWWSGR